MKKLFVTALLAVSMFASAKPAKDVTPSFFINNYKFETVNDSIQLSSLELIGPANYVKFYDINRLVIKNVHNNRILIVDASNKVWADTTDSIDMSLPCGNYTVYSQANVRSVYKEY
jgi:hypothetical protein